MPLTYSVDADEPLVILRAEGELSASDLLAAREQYKTDDRLTPEHRGLLDLRLVTKFTLRSDEVRMLAGSRSTIGKITTQTYVAIVASSPESFGLARMYELARSDASDTMRVFDRYDDALSWIRATYPPELRERFHQRDAGGSVSAHEDGLTPGAVDRAADIR
ncbi:MAG: hypothetical protein JWO05_2480 [Gemmatimonadetes bacterium]|nr:hypothetical protein [Gemmatimonadota bacterium]